MQTGAFIVIDGIDGSGKATQTRLLVERLTASGHAVEKLDFPRYGTEMFGQFIGECLAGKYGDFLHLDPHIASTLYALDRFEASPSIRAARAAGKIVVADRFSSSNQIHQGGKIEDEAKREAFLSWLERMEHEVLGIPRPDVVVYLRVPVETSIELLGKERAVKNTALASAKDIVEDDRTYIERSFASVENLAKKGNWKAIECSDGNGLRTPKDIHEEVFLAVQSYIA